MILNCLFLTIVYFGQIGMQMTMVRLYMQKIGFWQLAWSRLLLMNVSESNLNHILCMCIPVHCIIRCSKQSAAYGLNKLPINDDSELIIVGDFNLPDVNWFSGNLKVCSDTTDRNLLDQLKFMDLFVQKGLTWHIKDQITRRRLVNGCLQESTLDQLLTSNEHMIEKLELSAPLGRSDHLVMNASKYSGK